MGKWVIKPRPLEPGDVVGLIAPASPVKEAGAVLKAAEAVRALGFSVKLGQSCTQVHGYLSGADAVRAQDINAMFSDAEVGGILCLKGGYGAARLLDKIDYAAVRRNPKVFIGYSDITALHAALFERCGLVTVHAPMPASCWAAPDFSDFSRRSVLSVLNGTMGAGAIHNPPGHALAALSGGTCEGRLIGGNLSLIVSLLGTPYAPDFTGRILFIEDIGEATYRLDRMLNQLRLAGAFDACAGVVFGDFADCPIEDPDYGLTIPEILSELVVPSKKPVVVNLRAGHCEPNLSLALGAMHRLVASVPSLTCLERPFA